MFRKHGIKRHSQFDLLNMIGSIREELGKGHVIIFHTFFKNLDQ